MVDAHADDNDPLLGRVIDGRFTIQSVLGRGGMGVVYRAHQASLERSVALKLMTGVPPEREAEFQRRFFLEAATAAKLKHPNTITVFDYGSSIVDDQRVFFIAMELIDGLTLSRVLSQGRSLSPLRSVSIGIQICRSLREAHKAGVVHRDLKPGNVMLVRQDDIDEIDGDFVKVLDFGLAKSRAHDVDALKPVEGITKAGTFMGSPRYVAPEQVEGRPVDARADIYSFGCMFFRMLSGKVPFDGKQAVEIMLKHVHDPVPPLDVDGLPLSIHKLVADCLEKDPSKRPPSMDAVLTRLKLIRAELGGTGSGIMVLSDERISMPPQPPVQERSAGSLSAPAKSIEQVSLSPMPMREVSSSRPRPRDVAAPSTGERVVPRTDPGPTETDWQLTQAVAVGSASNASNASNATNTMSARVIDETTASTRVMGQISMMRKPPRRPWLAIAAGVVVGLVSCAGLVAWRLELVEKMMGTSSSSPSSSSSGAPNVSNAQRPSSALAGPLAKTARIRVKTTPPGADVLEVQNGLPKLLGVTPLTIQWDVTSTPRELTLRKDGHHPSKATIAPPAAAEREPVWLDVEATLRPR